MARWLNSADPEFEDGFTALLAEKREQAADVNHTVAAIIARVRAEGDAALADLTLTFDRLDLGKVGL
jgi:histidinol dehydrogenase